MNNGAHAADIVGVQRSWPETFVVKRVQKNLVALHERRLLNWLCRQLPGWLTPDYLTAIGLGGAVLAAGGYAASNWRREFVLVACVGVVINWFGDSLDGSLARHRGIERPRLGYFIDHSIDALSTVFILVGIGASHYASMTAALSALVGYLLISMHVFLKNHVTGQMQLSFLSCGPTEMRITVVLLTLIAYLIGVNHFQLFGVEAWPYSLILYAFGVVIIPIFVKDTLNTVQLLQRQDRKAASR